MTPSNAGEPSGNARLIDYLRRTRGTDLSSYKAASIGRRIAKRLKALQIPSADEYVDYLEVHPDEFDALLDTLLINVTSFFRDPDTWAYVASEIIPPIVERGEPIRIWVPGCASGEEPYTVGMLFAAALGETEFRTRVKVFATDLDAAALDVARRGIYPAKALESIPEELRTRFFAGPPGEPAHFKNDLRHNFIFGPHDLTRDAPIRNVDLVCCRNTLMYFNADTQRQIATRLHFALKDTGFLIVGRAEGMFSQSALFRPASSEHRVFAKVPGDPRPGIRFAPADSDTGVVDDPLTATAVDALPSAILVVDPLGRLVSSNAAARDLFGIVRGDNGRPLHELEVSYRPVELRSLIDYAIAARRTVAGPMTRFEGPPERFFAVDVTPLLDANEVLGVCVMFTDATKAHVLDEEHAKAKADLEAAYEELQSTNEELETTNEELQSTIEELETTNEELQSTNEELETMNEELQSTNEELQTLNDELRLRTEDLDETNAFLESVLRGLERAVIVVDDATRILSWNDQAEDLWGLRRAEVAGLSLFSLDVGFPLEPLREPIRTVLSGEQVDAIVTEGLTRRGRRIPIRVTVNPLRRGDRSVRGAILMMGEVPDGATE